MSIQRMFQLLLFGTGIITLCLFIFMLRVLSNQQALVEAADYRFEAYKLGQEASFSSAELARLARTYVITGDKQYERGYWRWVNQIMGEEARPDGRTVAYEDLLRERHFSNEELGYLKRSTDLSIALVETEEEAFALIDSDRERAIAMLFDAQYHTNVERIDAPVGRFQKALDKRTGEQLDGIVSSSRSSVTIALVLAGVVLVMVVLSYFVINQRVIKPVSLMVRETETVAQGDLSRRVEIHGEDEIAKFGQAFNSMLSNLCELMVNVREGADFLHDSSEKLAHISADNHRLMQQQKSETHLVATAATEMTASIQEVANNCLSAAGASEEADGFANNGKAIVDDTVDTISNLSGKIDGASSSISELQTAVEGVSTVVDVINGIAEQTNLLALNAAIEAARAGEQGRGFAVVADEVRTLAQRTQDSTNEILEVVELLQNKAQASVSNMTQSREQTQTVVEKSNQAGGALGKIAESVAVINQMTTQIAQASEEQSTVAQDIGERVSIIDSTTTNTVELGNQLSSMTEELDVLAKRLNDQIGQFSL